MKNQTTKQEIEMTVRTKHLSKPLAVDREGMHFLIGTETTRHDYLKFDYCVAKTIGNSMVDEANANRLALCWNNHDSLLEALECLEADCRAVMPTELVKHFGASRQKARLAIEQARHTDES